MLVQVQTSMRHSSVGGTSMSSQGGGLGDSRCACFCVREHDTRNATLLV